MIAEELLAPSTTKIRILVVDDHPAVREALAMRIAQHPDLAVCGEAEEVLDALRLCSELKPDIVITDISLKKSDGVDLIKRIKARDENHVSSFGPCTTKRYMPTVSCAREPWDTLRKSRPRRRSSRRFARCLLESST